MQVASNHSGLLIPKYMADSAVPPPETPDIPETEETDLRGSYLPTPSGYKILCAVPEAKETFDDSVLVKAEQFMQAEQHSTTILFVLRVGPDAYADKAKFPSGPWCKEGDFVVARAYSGTRFKLFGKQMRVLNDDQLEAVVQDPRGFTHA